MTGLLEGQPILIGCIYAPNVEQDQYWDKLTKVLAHYTAILWLLGGDYNCVLDLHLDRSHPPPLYSPAHKQTDRFRRWVEHWTLVDAWRARNPDARMYSFHSIPHNLRVRHNRFLCSTDLLPKMQYAYYMGRIVSDHDAHIGTLRWRPPQPPVPTWKLPQDCLTDQAFRHIHGEYIQEHFLRNAGSASSRAIE